MPYYEYKILSPSFSAGQVSVGFKSKTITEKNFLGKEKTRNEYVEVYQTELEWLNDLGKDGWELIQVEKNPYSNDIRNYYFKRLNRSLAEKRDDNLNEILNDEN